MTGWTSSVLPRSQCKGRHSVNKKDLSGDWMTERMGWQLERKSNDRRELWDFIRISKTRPFEWNSKTNVFCDVVSGLFCPSHSFVHFHTSKKDIFVDNHSKISCKARNRKTWLAEKETMKGDARIFDLRRHSWKTTSSTRAITRVARF